MSKQNGGFSEKSKSNSYFSEDHFFVKLFHNIPTPKSLANFTDRKLVDVNKAWEEFTGYPKAKVMGFRVEDLNLISIDNANKIRGVLEQEKIVKAFEVDIKVVNGQIKTCLATFQYLEIEGVNYVQTTLLDITDLKQAQEYLKREKKFSEDLIHSLSQGLVVMNVSGEIIDVNPSFCQITQFDKHELIGAKAPFPFWPPESINEIQECLSKTLKGNKGNFEFMFMRKGGDRFPVSLITSSIKNKDGKTNSFFVTVEDISEKLKVRAALDAYAKQSILKKDTILELSGLVGTDFEVALNKITSLSAKALNVERVSVWRYNKAKTEIKCIYLFNLSTGIIEKGMSIKRGNNLKYFERLDKNKTICVDDALNNEITKGFAQDYLKPLGITSMLDVFLKTDFGLYGIICFEHVGKQRHWSAEDQEFSSSIANIVTLMVENSERKKAEAKLIESETNLIKSQKAANIGSYKYDIQSNTWVGTNVLEDIFGIDASYKRTQDNWNALIHADDIEGVFNYFTDIISKRHKKVGIEYRIIRHKDKAVRWVNSIGELSFNKDGIPTYIFGTIQDITEKKTIELQIKDTNEKLYQSNIELNKLREQLEHENIYLRDELQMVFNYEEMVYGSTEFSNVLSEVEKVAPTNATVLLLGESGTGKELLARAIYNTSLRNTKPFIKVNCSAIPRELMESELFGHKKGSFTGAFSDKMGKFELAHEGTLFLDEIGELPLDMQPKLLRFLQEGEIEVIGGTGMKKLNVRVIAATNRNLKEEILNNRFREDLYFRLNVFPILVPPLRNRKDDIPLLVEHFIDKFNKKYSKNIQFISDHAMRQLRTYEWPGNIRELENLIERAIILSIGDTLSIPGFESNAQIKKTRFAKSYLTLDAIQRNHILEVLEQCKWRINGPKGASMILDLKPSTLRDKMSKLGIAKPNKNNGIPT